jgi:tetratricopeptide (TPR) repeat protein
MVMTSKYVRIVLATISISAIGLAAVVPMRQAYSQDARIAAQPVQDSDFFLKRAIERLENADSDQARQAALADLQQAIKLNPRNAMAYAHRGSVIWSDDRKAAMQDFDRAVEIAPDSLDTRGFRASFRELSGDNRGAIADLTHILKLAPEEAPSRYLRCIILMRDAIKDYKAALVDIDYLIEKDQVLKHRDNPYRNSRYQMRARVREKLGDKKGAIADLKIAESGKAQDLEASKREQKALEMELESLRSYIQRLQGAK